jgi:hypothetical protein
VIAFIERAFLASAAANEVRRAEKPKVGELQMDWLRSEDLKEEKDVTAPIVIIAVLEARLRSIRVTQVRIVALGRDSRQT